MKIQVSGYNFKSKPGQNETGFIAQQLYTALLNVVNRGGDDAAQKPWTVDYGRVTPLLTRAIQDVNGIVKEQQGEIDVLKKQIGRQNARLKVLEAENAQLAAIVSKVESLEQAVNGPRAKAAPHPVALNQ
jgi:small-conductance mechanosensitive channel